MTQEMLDKDKFVETNITSSLVQREAQKQAILQFIERFQDHAKAEAFHYDQLLADLQGG